MTWSKRLMSGPRPRHMVVLMTGIVLLLAILMAADLSRAQEIVLLLGIATIGATLMGLVRFLVLRETQCATQSILEALPNPVYLKDMDGRYTGVNRAWEVFFGVTRTAVVGKTAQELDGNERAVIERLDASDQTLRQRTGFHVYEDVILRPDGTRLYAILCKALYTPAGGRTAGVVGTIIDITDRKKVERRLAMEHAVTRVLAEAEDLDKVVPTIIATICTTMGWHYGAMYKYHPAEGMLRCADMWGIDTPQVREFMAAVGRRSVSVGDAGKGLIRRTFALGKPVWISNIALDETLQRKSLVVKAGLHGAFAFPLRGGHEVLGILEFFHADVLEPDATLLEIAESIGSQIGQYIVRRRTEAEKRQAMHDAVTGLPNRRLFMERVEHAVVQAQRHQRRMAVMFIDLDRFKQVNDTLGHEAGDMLLKEVSRRLKLNLRQGDTVARLGGDEFVMLLEEITSERAALQIGEKLLAELGRASSIAAEEVTVTASIGISTYPADAADVATLLRHGDAAMYRAKGKGRNRCELYSDGSTPRPQGALHIIKGN